jgi:response regulator RpfG family c-di-GMP phosphodiesterase
LGVEEASEMIGSSPGKLLVVDDDPRLRLVLAANLRSAGYEVLEAEDGQRAVECASQSLPDVIVMDISMPVMDGIEATRRIRANARTEHIPVLMLTARAKTQDLLVGLEVGAQDYIRKPFEMPELLARVRTMHRLVMARRALDEMNIRLEQEVDSKTRRLQLLYHYMRDLNGAEGRDQILDLVVRCVEQTSTARRISVLLVDEEGERLTCVRALGIDPAIVESINVSTLQGISGQVFQTGVTLSAVALGRSGESRDYDGQAFLCTPLVSTLKGRQQRILGVVNVTNLADDLPFSGDIIDCIRSIADAAAIALDNNQRQVRLEQSVRVLLRTVGHLAEYRDEETTLHLQRVTLLARIIGDQLAQTGPYRAELTPDYIEMLAQAAPMHDIGKVGIPDEILTKPGSLTAEEFQIMKTHTEIGRKVLSRAFDPANPVPLLSMCIEIANSHHEKWDGSGYPRRLKGEDIPLSARIIALVDAYDAITSRRRYKKERSHEEAVEVIKRDSGRHFDPAIVDAFRFCHERFDTVRARYADTAVGELKPAAVGTGSLPALRTAMNSG